MWSAVFSYHPTASHHKAAPDWSIPLSSSQVVTYKAASRGQKQAESQLNFSLPKTDEIVFQLIIQTHTCIPKFSMVEP